MTYGFIHTGNRTASIQPIYRTQEPGNSSTRRYSDQLILDLLPGLKNKNIRYYESKEQIHQGIQPEWLADIMLGLNLSEGDICFLMSNLKDIAPDSSMRIMNKRY